MAIRLVRHLAAAAALLLLLARPSDLASCGPFFRMALFTRVGIPENEKAFFAGQIGIVQPTYWRRYLAMSYRILQGIPLTPSQVASIAPVTKESIDAAMRDAPVDRWNEARNQVPGSQPVQIDRYKDGGDFTRFPNCGEDAFLTAVTTLNDRIRVAGASSAEVRDWLAAQDLVFSNCAAQTNPRVPDPPAPAPPGSSNRIVADRDYQIAAAHLYAGLYAPAKGMFEKIAADAGSPWHTLAPYLEARADIRQGDYATAQSELRAILSDPKLATIHGKSASLLEYVDAKVDPQQRLAVCAKRLLIPDSPTLAHDLVDYTFLYDKLEPIKAPRDEITTWIEQFRTGEEDDLVKRWEQDHSLPWLVAALYHADAESSRADELIDAARQVPFASPAWPTVRFHAVRLLIAMGKKPEARQMLSEIIGHLKGASASTTNGFRAEQTLVAENLNEFLTAAPRVLGGDGIEGYHDESDVAPTTVVSPMFDHDTTAEFNAFIPLTVWLASVKDTGLPKGLRTVLAQAGFVRAAVLDDAIALDFARALRQLKPAYAADMDRYLAAPKDRRLFEAVFWLVHHPEASTLVHAGYGGTRTESTPDGQIDSFHDNWWCAKPPDDKPAALLGQLSPEGWGSPPFLTAQQKASAAAEMKALAAAGGGPGFLSKTVLAWARAHPDDTRLPEALALAVKSSHFGCTDPDSAGPVSQAFALLHNRFPNSPWTKQTPYWYK